MYSFSDFLTRAKSVIRTVISLVITELAGGILGKQVTLTPPMRHYLNDLASEYPELRELGEKTRQQGGDAAIQTDASQIAFMAWLIGITKAKRVLEFGTSTGYGTLGMALALPADGKVVTCELTPDLPKIGLPHWERAGVEPLIDIRIGDPVEAITELMAAGETFDLVFIDAHRPDFDRYLELAVPIVAQGGVIVIDNVLWSDRAANTIVSTVSATTTFKELFKSLRQFTRVPTTLQAFNARMFGKTGHPIPNLVPSMLPCWGGMILLQKK